MSKIDRFIHDVQLHLAAPKRDKERFLNDLDDQAREMLESGLSETEVLKRLGSAEEIASEFMQQRELQYAGIIPRFFAFMVDAAISTMFIFPGVFLLVLLPMGLVDGGVFWSFNWNSVNPPRLELSYIQFGIVLLAGLTATGIALFYFPVMEHMFGWTIGKRVFGMRVLREDGTPVGLGAAFVRRLSYYFDILALDAIFVPFTKMRQRAFDRVAGTVVVKDGEPSWLGILLFFVLAAILTVLGIYTIIVLSAMPEPIIGHF
ncbi:RDD family protein [bacterium]|nr:RDD family protein [bacterium]